MKYILPALFTTVLSAVAFAESPNAAVMNFADKATAGKPDVTYGRVKELTAGQKVVIDVDDAIDKSFDLTDKDVAVKLASGLKVGDPVKITERSVAGKTKSVQITRHAGGNVSHGDKKTAAGERKEAK
jgi:hypothetical protein